MSFINKRNNNITPKPFCKVCKDAGLTEKEYTSHYVKSDPGPEGKVVCPTLLAQECRYCLGHGHTAKYCPIIETNRKAEERAIQRITMNKPLKTKPYEKKLSNSFANLNTDNEQVNEKKIYSTDFNILSNQENKKSMLEDFPALSPISKKIVPTTSIVGYASVAAKKPENYENTKYEEKLILKSKHRRLPPIKNTRERRITPIKNEYLSDYDSNYEDEEIEDDEITFINEKEIVKRKSLLDWSTSYESEDEKW